GRQGRSAPDRFDVGCAPRLPLGQRSMTYLEGLLFGVVPVFFVGPVLFTLLRASLRDGTRAGMRVAVGIALSDVVCVAICLLGLSRVFTSPTGEQVLQVGGGLIMLLF